MHIFHGFRSQAITATKKTALKANLRTRDEERGAMVENVDRERALWGARTVERISQFGLFELGQALERLRNFKGDVPVHDAFIVLMTASKMMEKLRKGDPLPITVSIERARELENTVDGLLREFFYVEGEDGKAKLSWPEAGQTISDWRWKGLVGILDRFETVFAEDMRENAVYYVPRRGIFFTKALVDAAHEAFPTELLPHISDGVAALEAIRETYNTKLALQAPTTYWANKRTGHRKVAAGWGLGFAFAALFGGAFVWQIWQYTAEPVLKKFEAATILAKGLQPPSYGIFLPTIGAAFLVVWVLRIFSRQLLASFSFAADAGERVAMVNTFLALMQKPDHVRENDRILILSSLFRPAPSSNEDATPPNWFDLLMDRVRK